MKKFVFLFFITIFLLLGCTNNDNNDYSSFLADEEGSYYLYYVADPEVEEDQITLEDFQGLRNLSNFRGGDSLEAVEGSDFPEMEEVPTYIVFDTEEKVYETNSRDDLFEFLQEN